MSASVKSTFKSLFFVTTLFLSCWLLSCGKQALVTDCGANFFEGDFSAKVTYIEGSINTFQFKICTNTSHIDQQVTVYGVQYETDIAGMSLPAHARLSHMSDGLHVGDVFDVTFGSSDGWFIIYADDNLGAYSNADEVVRGGFR